MTIRIKRRLLLVVAGLFVVASAAVVGAAFAHPSASPVQQALDKGYRAGTNRFDLSVSIGTGGKQFTLRVKGAYDLRNNRGAFTVDFGQLFAGLGLKVNGRPPPSKLDMILNRNVLYVHVPPSLLTKESQGKEWLKVDPRTLPKSQTSGADLSGISSLNPRTALTVLAGATSVRTLGPETVGGVRMTRYRVVVVADKLADAVTASERADIRAFMKQLGLTSTTVDVWVDGPGYVRRITSLPVTLKGTESTQPATLKMTMSFWAHGSKVTVTVPPASKTVDVGKALGEVGGGTTTTTTTTTRTTTTPTAPGGSVRPAVAFTQAGASLGQPLAAPRSANGLVANINPQSGVIMNAYWLKDGKWLGVITVPSGASGLVFTTSPSASPGTPLTRPKAATAFHVSWTGGVITAASWTSLGKPLATIPVSSGQQAIAFTNGG